MFYQLLALLVRAQRKGIMLGGFPIEALSSFVIDDKREKKMKDSETPRYQLSCVLSDWR